MIPPVELRALTHDGVAVTGRVVLRGGRIADLLSLDGPIPVEELALHALADGSRLEHVGGVVATERLAVVTATGPRGSRYDRVRTVAGPVTLHVARYLVHGTLHAPEPGGGRSGGSPRRPWLAVTDAVVQYEAEGAPRAERLAVVLVNRRHVRAIVRAALRPSASPSGPGASQAASAAPAGVAGGADPRAFLAPGPLRRSP